MGSPRSPKSPKTHKARFRMPWDYRKSSGSPRIRNFPAVFKSGEFARLMSSKDKKNARATLEAQQYLDGVYRACAVAPPAFLADVFAESPRKKRRQA